MTIRTRFPLSHRLPIPGRPARIVARRVVGRDAQGSAVYEAQAVDDELRFITGYLDGWGRWCVERPALAPGGTLGLPC